MIRLFPAKCHDEILHCSVGAGVVMNHHTTRVRMPHCLLWIARHNFWSASQDTCIYCGALRQEVHKQNAFPVRKHCAYDLPSWSGLLEFGLCWQWSVSPLHGLLLQFRGFMRHPCLVPCDYMAQEVFAFLTALCQKVQRTGLPFQFLFFRTHLRHPVCTQFPKLKFIRQFCEEVTVKFEENGGKWCNGETSNLLFKCTHQI